MSISRPYDVFISLEMGQYDAVWGLGSRDLTSETFLAMILPFNLHNMGNRQAPSGISNEPDQDYDNDKIKL